MGKGPLSMGIASVFALLAVWGAVAVGGEISGFVRTEIELDFDDPWPDAVELDLELGIEYGLSDWTFGTLLDVEEDGLEDLAFLWKGSLGAFNIYSLQWFAVDEGLYTDFDNAVWTDAAGPELWAFFSIQTEDGPGGHLSGAGLAVGGHGTAGDVGIWAEMQFNLEEMLPFIYWNGLETAIDKDLACDLIYVLDPTCELDFTFAEVYVEFPFCCAELGGWLGFDCDGFYGFEVWVEDVAIGDSGLALDCDLWFDVEGKDLDLRLRFDIGESLCITPYVTLVQEDPLTVSGLEVDALELVCALGDVTVTVSEVFPCDEFYIGIDGAVHKVPIYDSSWSIPAECVEEAYGVEEALAIEVRRGGCCGGESSLGLYNFFDIDLDDVLFDWLGLRARAEAPISPSLSVFVETWIWYDGIGSIAFGFDVDWGTLRALTSDWTCCLGSF